MNNIDKYFIELASGGKVPLRYLGENPCSYECQWNRQWHALDNTGVAKCLADLFAKGYIFFEAEGSRLSLHANEIVTHIQETDFRVCYGLTNKGGNSFEKEFLVDWTRYYYLDLELNYITLTSRTEHLNRLLTFVAIDNGIECFDAKPKVSVISPWSPNYWKTFAFAYQVTVSCKSQRTCFSVPAEWLTSERLYWKWYNGPPEPIKT